MAEQIPGYIREAGQKASEAIGAAGETMAGTYTVGDLLQKKITEAYAYNKDIIDKLDQNTQQYFSAPAEARERYQNIFNPFSRENLVSQYVGNQALPMLSQANVLGARMGGISDLVRSGVQGYQAQATREQARAEQLQQNYQNILGEYQLEQQLNAKNTQEVTAGGRKYLLTYDRNGNVTNKVDLGPSGTGGGGGLGADFMANLKALGIIPGGNQTSNQVNSGSQYWEDVQGFDDLDDRQRQEALRRSINSDKSVDEIAREILGGQGASSQPRSGGVYGATGTPAADVNYSGLTVPQGWRP